MPPLCLSASLAAGAAGDPLALPPPPQPLLRPRPLQPRGLTAAAVGRTALLLEGGGGGSASSSGGSGKFGATSFAYCRLGRLWTIPNGLPCRDDEEESCNEVHATCAKVPQFGASTDPADPQFKVPRKACKPDKPPGAKPPDDTLGAIKGGAKAQVKETAKENLRRELGMSGTDRCNARMVDLPYGLYNPEAEKNSMASASRGFLKRTLNAPLSQTVWGTAVHGLSGSWAFDSHGGHAADYVFQLPQRKGAPSDYYICDSRERPQHCALLGGNLQHACVNWYDPKMCNFCEDKGDSLVCQVRGWNGFFNKWAKVPIYPRDLLGELYRGEFRDTFARPMWASVELQKAALMHVKLLPEHMISIGPAQQVLKYPKVKSPPLWINPFAAGVDVAPGLLAAGPFLRRPPRRRPVGPAARPAAVPRPPVLSRAAAARNFL